MNTTIVICGVIVTAFLAGLIAYWTRNELCANDVRDQTKSPSAFDTDHGES